MSQIAGHLLVQCLIQQGVTHAFGVPGESYLAVLDGFHAHADRIRFVTNRQEGGAAFMAEAQGKLTGRPGVCFVTRGPGATNASIGLHTAFQDSTPMVLFIGDVASDARDREAFQEVDYLSFFGPSTKGMAKRVERIDDARRIPEYVARAFATAMNGRPGPVVLVLPEDMLTQTVDAEPLPRVEAVQAWSDPGALRELRTLLLASERPLVIAGGGGWTPQSAAALQRFAENWQLPVTNAFRFQDTFDNHHALYAGDVGLGINPALARRVRESDLLIAIGPRLGESTTGGYTLIEAPVPKQKLVHIHASAEELGRVYQPTLAINATMNAAARSLEVLTAPPTLPWVNWTEACHADYLANIDPANGGITLPGTIDMPAIIHTLQKHLPADAVLTNGAGNFASWLHRFFRYSGLVKGHKTQLAPTNGAMGYGVPAGIGAAILTGRTAFTIAGDGDFLMNGQELATAVQHGAKSIVLLLNNGSFGTIRMHQEREYPANVSGSALANPDFCALARAYGYAAERITHTAGFEAALQRALAAPGGSLIEVMIDVDVITTRGTLTAIRHNAQRR
ncbi:MAG: thiamine pyrophosphate-binding protein [Hydrogenophaga sp.]|uniref:thiamine pyrophosphate-binding protein n=1 Tax=Hydrogenophaga sp. TaxID=1904254 RepID=UPI00272F4D22|nr:thiamine pyrophosphate-binding protein [Hydrogenophaga sp.]MDP2250283.1 thiamine pyrophosphate-binding protein [Hydrogenophaga sp.]MDP2988471.1 thiamine pyrophosphate-binding protein [Hydrogenophaga sp.]MDP3629270.1 thiamine pyrophosphate-binding protein [Hydrogenophaga sp.]MDZ4127197.1 thiamine pyrophosphate-binding protein [Hydrogenophaga sp.]